MIGEFFTALLKKITAVLVWVGELFKQIFKDLWEVVIDLWCWPFDQIMKLVKSLITSLDLSGIEGYVNAAGALPGEIVNILSLLGVGTCIAIITAAIGIRLLLQLIPFVSLGS